MPIAGLMTGAGAAEGLEDLLARMRAEEQLAQRGRALDVDEFNSRSLDENRRGTLAEDVRQFDTMGPTRTAGVANTRANTAQTTTETEGLTQRNSILKGLREDFGGGVTGVGGVPDLNNPSGRLRLRMADVPPNDIYGAVDTDNTGDEKLVAAYMSSIGKPGQQPSYQDIVKALAGKPNTVISQGNLDLRRGSEADRKQMHTLRIKLAERDIAGLDPLQRAMALAEFRNRIQNDVEAAPNFAQRWILGQETPDDPDVQIEAIKQDVLKKYGQGQAAPTTPVAAPGSDIDAILQQRRRPRQ